MTPKKPMVMKRLTLLRHVCRNRWSKSTILKILQIIPNTKADSEMEEIADRLYEALKDCKTEAEALKVAETFQK